jgi:hypothetical protein
MALESLQHRMVDYLLNNNADIDMLVSGDATHRKERLSIYSNGYFVRLRETLQVDHEILWSYLGDDLFDVAVEGYIRETPSKHRSLRHYGDSIPDYLKETELFSDIPVIADLARFERLLLEVFDAPESNRLSNESLANVPATAWPGMKLKFHPSVRLIALHTNAVEIWKALKEKQVPPGAEENKNHWVCWRNSERLSEFRPVDSTEYEILQLISQAYSLADLCEFMASILPEDDVDSTLMAYLSLWNDHGILSNNKHEYSSLNSDTERLEHYEAWHT